MVYESACVHVPKYFNILQIKGKFQIIYKIQVQPNINWAKLLMFASWENSNLQRHCTHLRFSKNLQSLFTMKEIEKDLYSIFVWISDNRGFINGYNLEMDKLQLKKINLLTSATLILLQAQPWLMFPFTF